MQSTQQHRAGGFPSRVEVVTASDIRQAQSPSTKMLLAISATGRSFYEGTVSQAVIQRRRAKNRAARQARRAARR